MGRSGAQTDMKGKWEYYMEFKEYLILLLPLKGNVNV